jgi:hypothetical protein
MKYIAALVALSAVISIGVTSKSAQAEICPLSPVTESIQATVFDLYVYDSGGSAINDSNKAERWEILTFAWNICPDAIVTDNFGNARYGDYQFQRGISDQPQGGFNWIVSSQGDTRTYWVPINDQVSPPPPPPAPSYPYEFTCCNDHSSTSSRAGEEISSDEARLNGVVLPLNFSTSGSATNKCWRNHGPDALDPTKPPEYKKQGIWPYMRKVTLRVYWCAVKGVRIVGSNAVVDPSVSGGGQCSVTGTNKFKVSGGNGYHNVVWQGKAFFKCIVFIDLPLIPFDELNLDQWVQGIYYDLGGHFLVKAGGS